MSNSREDASVIDFLDTNERPSPELLAVHRRLEADGAAWRRRHPSSDSLQRWVSRGGLRQHAMATTGERARSGVELAPSPLPQRPAPASSRRLQGLAAASVALATVLLFGLLIHAITSNRPATSTSTPTAVATTIATSSATVASTGKWSALDGLTFTSAASVFGQAGTLAIAPTDTKVVYEAALSPVSLRRTRNGGMTEEGFSPPHAAGVQPRRRGEWRLEPNVLSTAVFTLPGREC
ncbi:MAG TPA: hypothetical protein VGP82_00600 [Ktedonobacterales bacterium]|nr:hypothetical protein [Ktedonobacterales bacterium]